MKISIVTISFNQIKFLRQCIESVLSQAGCDFEYIVVDPGSTDGSRQLIESYGEKIVTVFENDRGPADGLNKGFSLATGDVYGFINSDDYLHAGALSHVDKYFTEKGTNRFVTGLGYTEDSVGGRHHIKALPLSLKNMLHRSAVMFQQATFFPAQAYRNVGGFNIRNSTCWDYELFLKLLIDGLQHEVMPVSLATFRLHEESISGSGRLTAKYLKELDRIFFDVCGRDRNFADKFVTVYLRLMREILNKLKPRATNEH